MSLEKKIDSLVKLAEHIKEDGPALNEAKLKAKVSNPWFTIENIDKALISIADNMLDKEILQNWISGYNIHNLKAHNVGLILAGNIPLVGFHDILCTYLSGHKAKIKSSSKDSVLTKSLTSILTEIDEDKKAFEYVDNLKEIDALIATGSNHSAKQFERYFGKYPNIIRRNRNAVAVLSGKESKDEIVAFGRDVFQYFGLGCRNVSKVYFPKSMDKTGLMEILHDQYSYLINHSKYNNNYDYNYAVYLLNQDDFLASGAVILRRHEDIISRIACLHYEDYGDIQSVTSHLKENLDKIQCISSNMSLDDLQTVSLGDCQNPKIDDYADGVDTMDFLTNLKI